MYYIWYLSVHELDLGILKNMQNNYSFLDLAQEVLEKAEIPLTPREIWNQAVAIGLDIKLASEGKTPWATLASNLYTATKDPDKETVFIRLDLKPARFTLKVQPKWPPLAEHKTEVDTPEQPVAEASQEIDDNFTTEEPQKALKLKERDLHPLFAYYAYHNPAFNRGRRVFTKTIFHEKSKKRQQLNEWVHPDIVGFYMPAEDWDQTLLAFNDQANVRAMLLYSFELKLHLNKSNYREAFFQTVSNSSWANEGYLVTADFEKDDDLTDELSRLSASFGIGLILLNTEAIGQSKVVFPARRRDILDWELMNKLCLQNPDFRQFIENTTKDYQVKRYTPTVYDDVIQDPDKYLQNFL